MALSKDGLKTVLLGASEGQSDGSVALSNMAGDMSAYIIDNAVISFSWVATNPSNGSPDPQTTVTGEIISLIISLTQSGADNQPSAMTYLANEITTSFQVGSYNITESGFSTTSAIMSDIPALSINFSATDRDDAFDKLATQIIDWITSYIPASVCSGTHGVYVGVGTPVSVT